MKCKRWSVVLTRIISIRTATCNSKAGYPAWCRALALPSARNCFIHLVLDLSLLTFHMVLQKLDNLLCLALAR
eukprot:558391-Amphidinium_carterae.1